MKRVLITGAAGFIGFHAALALAKRGDHVLGIDNFNNYYDPRLKEERATLLKEKGIEVIKADLNDRELLFKLCHDFAPTDLLHLGAQAGVRYAKSHPEAYIKSNIDGFLSILELLRGLPHVNLVYASSSSVYGLNEEVPFSINHRTDRPANLYAATKKANELMAYSYNHLYGIRSTGLRFFTVYGPWGRPDMAYYSFSKAILEGKPIELFNEGKMSRDFTYIGDIIAGTLAALDLRGECEIFNLGNHQPVTLFTFVKLLEKVLNKKAEVVLSPHSPGEVETTFADIDYAKERLGYFPKTSLEEGLAHFAKWFVGRT